MIEKFELTKIQKLTISAFFIALVIIFSKLLSIGNIPGVPFLRVSLGPTLLIFASLLLGPIYGGTIGFLSDLIGYFTLDRTGYAYNPLFSITYILYGILPASPLGLYIGIAQRFFRPAVVLVRKTGRHRQHIFPEEHYAIR